MEMEGGCDKGVEEEGGDLAAGGWVGDIIANSASSVGCSSASSKTLFLYQTDVLDRFNAKGCIFLMLPCRTTGL